MNLSLNFYTQWYWKTDLHNLLHFLSLRADPHAAPGWADELDAQASADQVQRDGVWGGVRRAFDCLADPRVLDAVTPKPGEEFDPAAFVPTGPTSPVLPPSLPAPNGR